MASRAAREKFAFRATIFAYPLRGWHGSCFAAKLPILRAFLMPSFANPFILLKIVSVHSFFAYPPDGAGGGR